MNTLVIFSLGLLISTQVFAQSIPKKDKDAIMQVLNTQEEAWNKADIEGFMDGYWKSEKLRFIGKSGINYGWQKTLDNYKKGYPDAAAMGKLRFDILHMEKTGKRTAFVIGKWHLDRTAGNLEGHFTLLWRKRGKKWVIVADHSS